MNSKKYRAAAKGQECTANIAGICNYNSDTVVLCHFPSEGHGISIKSSDISAGDCCSICHDAIDGRIKCEEYTQNSHFYLRRSQLRTILRRIEQDVIIVK